MAQLLPLRRHRTPRRQLRHPHRHGRTGDPRPTHPEQLFDSLAISVNGPAAWDLDLSLDVTFTDLDTNYRLTLRNGVLIYINRPAENADATLTLTKDRMLGLLAGDTSSPGIDITGDAAVLDPSSACSRRATRLQHRHAVGVSRCLARLRRLICTDAVPAADERRSRDSGRPVLRQAIARISGSGKFGTRESTRPRWTSWGGSRRVDRAGGRCCSRLDTARHA